jgi:c-di-GMP-binding flagellar brake protein YcgR
MTTKSLPVDATDRLDRNLSLLQSGSIVTIDLVTPAGQRAKFRTYFIGYLPKKYVMIQCPSQERLGRFSVHIKQGLHVTVRGLVEGQRGAAVAFTSTIKQTIKIPSHILVLAFPKQVILQTLRKSLRVDTEIRAIATFKKERWRAEIQDLSVQGCQLFIENGEKLKLLANNPVDILVEEFESVYDVKLTGIVCNSKITSKGILLGIKLDESCKEGVIKLLHVAVTAEF